jgi:hypothetical protein
MIGCMFEMLFAVAASIKHFFEAPHRPLAVFPVDVLNHRSYDASVLCSRVDHAQTIARIRRHVTSQHCAKD